MNTLSLPRTLPLWWWLVPVLLLSALLAARLLNADILFVDEYFSIRVSGGDRWGPLSPWGIWQQNAELDPGGMGYFYHLTLAAWNAVIGSSLFSVRAFSWVMGLLALALTVRLGRDLFGQRVGVWAGVILGLSAFYIDYLHEARAYTLVTLLTVLSVWLYTRLMFAASEPRWWHYLALILSIGAMLYTHYVVLAIGGLLGLYHLLRFQRTRRWWRTLAALIAGALLFLPWVEITLRIVERGAGEVTRHATSMQADEVVTQLAHAFSNANIALLLILLALAWLGHRRYSGLIAWWAGGFLAAVLIVNALVPFMVHTRYLMPLWPALAILCALAVEFLRQRRVPVMLILGSWVLIGSLHNLNPAFISGLFGQLYRAPAAGFNQALDVIDARKQPDDLLLVHFMPREWGPFGLFPMGYYFDPLGLPYDQIEFMGQSFFGGDNDYLRVTEDIIGDAPAIWTLIVPEVPVTNRFGVVDYVLRTRYTLCETSLDRADIRLSLYLRPTRADPAPSPGQTFAAPEASLIVLTPRPPTLIDERLHVVLGWQAGPALPPNRYAISVQLLNPDGTLAAQSDQPLPPLPPDWPFACTGAALDIAGLPAADYRLTALVYDFVSGERLPVADSDRADLGPLTLGAP